MTTYKRVAGNLIVETTGATDTVTFQGPTANAATVVINGNLTVSGNAALTGNISGDNIFNGTTSIAIPTASGNATVSVGGVSNVAVFATSGQFVTGLVSVTGNVIGGNLVSLGALESANLNTTGNIVLTHTSGATTLRMLRFADSNTAVTTLGSNIGAIEWFTNDATGAGARVTARIRAVYSDTAGNANIQIQTGATATPTTRITILGATGNVGVANAAPLHTFAVSGNTYTSGNASVVGNITGGNILSDSSGQISTNGNVTGGNLRTATLFTNIGNAGSAIENGGGNLVGNIGNASTYFDTAFLRSVTATGNVTGGNINSNQLISATGNIYSGGNLLAQDNVSVTGNVLGNELRVGNANVSGNSFGSGIGVENIVWQSTTVPFSSASQANVGVLGFLALAGRSYKYEAYMPVLPAGATTTGFSTYFDAGTCYYTVEAQTTQTSTFNTSTSNTSGTVAATQSMTGTTPRTVRITGTIYSAGNANVAIQAQTSTANIDIQSGAFLTYTRIS